MDNRIKNKEPILAIVTATVGQLAEIGIDGDVSGKEVKVYDIDKYGGMYPPCSGVIFDGRISWLSKEKIKSDYIIPTRWLSFL